MMLFSSDPLPYGVALLRFSLLLDCAISDMSLMAINSNRFWHLIVVLLCRKEILRCFIKHFILGFHFLQSWITLLLLLLLCS